MRKWQVVTSALLASLVVACTPPAPATYPFPSTGAIILGPGASPRISGRIGGANRQPPAEISLGSGQQLAERPLPPGRVIGGPVGLVSLDFADTDIRAVVAQILGAIFKVNYTIDPAVKGTATFHSAHPLTGSQITAVLEDLLRQNGAVLLRTGDLYRVALASAAATQPGMAENEGMPGAVVVPLHYVSAGDLARVLQPVIGPGARIAPDPAQNALLVAGDPEARNAIVRLARSFDVDALAGQSYALFPVPQGTSAKDFANTLQDALHGRRASQAGASDLVRVLPLNQAGLVLVVASQPSYIATARRVFGLIEREQGASSRTWHVHYLQNSRAEDTAYLLQRAFTPNDVTAQPVAGAPNPVLNTGSSGMPAGGGTGAPGIGAGATGGAPSGLALAPAAATGGTSGAAPATQASAPATNPLLGGLEQGGSGPAADTMRILADPQNNSVLVYATAREDGVVLAMLRKVDLLPMQVRIDATIAEVTLNDQLKYGTQFFFKQGDVNETLSAGTLPTGAFANTFPGFVFGAGSSTVQAAISALQAVTQVKVLSSPELMVLDNQPAALQVGDLVPYLTQSSQSTLVAGAPVINSVNYRQTGVILKVTPRVDSAGLVTLDIAQEVSGVNTSAPQTPGIDSPTFSERLVQSRVVVHDGQTVGLAGLITDNTTVNNGGIPFLRNVPILGLLAGSQNNTRARTELLVLITPHVVHDERDAQALTQDMLLQMPNAAQVPAYSRTPLNSAADPGRSLRSRIGGTP